MSVMGVARRLSLKILTRIVDVVCYGRGSGEQGAICSVLPSRGDLAGQIWTEDSGRDCKLFALPQGR